jgi:hypothetical protein
MTGSLQPVATGVRAAVSSLDDAAGPEQLQWSTPPETVPVQVGVWGHFGLGTLRSLILARIVRAELEGRLTAATIRCFAPHVHPRGIDAGDAVEDLGPWSPSRAEQLAAELDAVVVTGPLDVPAGAYGWAQPADQVPDRLLYDGLGEELEKTCPVLYIGAEPSDHTSRPADHLVAALARHRYGPVADPTLVAPSRGGSTDSDDIPDVLLLTDRCFEGDLLDRREAYLRLMGWFPTSGPVIVVEGDDDLGPFAPALGRVLDTVAAERGATCVLLQSHLVGNDASFAPAVGAHLDRIGGTIPFDAGLINLIAAVANADVVVSSSRSLLAVALAFGRPCVGLDLAATGELDALAQWTGSSDSIISEPTELVSALRHAPTQEVLGQRRVMLQGRVDVRLDQVAKIITQAATARRVAGEAPVGVTSLTTRLRTVEAAYAALQRRIAAERLAFANCAEAFADRAAVLEADLEKVPPLLSELAEVRAELEAVYSTRTMRFLQPARRLYGRLRSYPE